MNISIQNISLAMLQIYKKHLEIIIKPYIQITRIKVYS